MTCTGLAALSIDALVAIEELPDDIKITTSVTEAAMLFLVPLPSIAVAGIADVLRSSSVGFK